MHPIHPVQSLAALAVAACLAAPSAHAQSDAPTVDATWPNWRGPARDGSAAGSFWADDLDDDALTETWRVDDLGPSYSGPIADAERVYTTETVDDSREVVRAFERASGDELWRTEWEGAMEVPFFASRNGSWIRSTPAVDEEALYVAGMRDVLECLDASTGDVRWSVNFAERFDSELPPFGCVSSPLVTDAHVYIQAGAGCVKLDKRTGDIVWRAMVDAGDIMSSGAFSSPILAELPGGAQLVVQSRTTLAGLNLADGAVLWSTDVKAFRGTNVLTPTPYGSGVFTSAYGGRAQHIELESSATGVQATRAWDSPMQGYMSSPVVVGSYAYIFLRSNRFGCIDLETGEEQWTSPPTGDSYWSLAVQGNRILSLSDTGMLRLVRATPEQFEVLAERQVTERESWAHIAPAGRQLFVRSQGALVALAWK